MQTTAIDSVAGMVNLTTTLAHASGEWIASDWPVCPIVETANPQRMGAALTYALFTLVGIAGEEDLDAPNLTAGTTPSPAPTPAAPSQTPRPAYPRPAPRKPGNGYHRGVTSEPAPVLDPGASIALRDKLTGKVASLTSSELAVTWAKSALASKNRLTASNAKFVEDRFERKLAELMASEAADSPINESLQPQDVAPMTTAEIAIADDNGGRVRPAIDKNVLKIAEPHRYRSKEHRRFDATQACVVCARKPSDPHHLRFMQPRALGRKVSDEFTVPLCRVHHRAAHRIGDERSWWTAVGVDPTKVAQKLWRRTPGIPSGPGVGSGDFTVAGR
jgi:hypothetical protein